MSCSHTELQQKLTTRCRVEELLKTNPDQIRAIKQERIGLEPGLFNLKLKSFMVSWYEYITDVAHGAIQKALFF